MTTEFNETFNSVLKSIKSGNESDLFKMRDIIVNCLGKITNKDKELIVELAKVFNRHVQRLRSDVTQICTEFKELNKGMDDPKLYDELSAMVVGNLLKVEYTNREVMQAVTTALLNHMIDVVAENRGVITKTGFVWKE